MITDISRFRQTLVKFDAANAADPNQDIFEGVIYPRELLYSIRMTTMLKHFEPNASETLQLAARCQHICRWKIPRDSYPMDRTGYKCWRVALYKFHGEISGEIMREMGYDEKIITDVQALLRKENIKTNPESQLLEDVVCLVFIKHYIVDFIKKYNHINEEKLLNIIRKTWKKMSPKGHATALSFNFASEVREVINKALTTI